MVQPTIGGTIQVTLGLRPEGTPLSVDLALGCWRWTNCVEKQIAQPRFSPKFLKVRVRDGTLQQNPHEAPLPVAAKSASPNTQQAKKEKINNLGWRYSRPIDRSK